MTTIEDTLTYIDGSKANGRLVVGWKPFTVGNVNAAGGELEWQIVEGAVSISLYANTGAQPTGSYYVVKYELENGAVYLEQWIVPDLPTVNLGQVRVAFPPSPSVMISPLQLTSLGAAPGMFLMWNGQRWVPGYPGTFSFVDPTLVKGDMIVRGDVAPATRLGVGLDGWTLIADSSQALGIKWVAPVSGFADPTTTKGDLIVRGNAGTTRIGVGSDGSALMADSTLPLGVKWATGGSLQTPWLSNISGAGFALWNVNSIGIGVVSTPYQLQIRESGNQNIIFTSSAGMASLQATNDAVNTYVPMKYAASAHYFTDGNVGIGVTTSPAHALEVVSGSAVAVTIGSNTTGAVGIGQTGSVPFIQGYASVAAASSAPLSLQPSGGNVGVGNLATVMPSSLTNLRLLVGSTASGGPSGALVLCGNVTAVPSQIGEMSFANYALSGVEKRSAIIMAATDSVGAYDNAYLAFYTMYAGTPNERMRISATGNLGVGTAAPGALISTGQAVVAPIKIATFDQGPGSTNAYGIGVATSQLTFGANINAASGTPQMVLTAAGYLGVGRTDPSFRVDAIGDVNCSGVFRIGGAVISSIIAANNVTGSRVLTNVYQNNTGKPIFVSIYATINAGQYIKLLADGGNPPTYTVFATTNGLGVSAGGSVCGWVMPSFFYKIDTPGGGATLISWAEWV